MDDVDQQLRHGRLEAALAATAEQPDRYPVERARVLALLGPDDEALAAADRAVAALPDDPRAYAARGLARLAAGDVQGAWADAETAHRAAPDASEAVVLLAELLVQHGRSGEAVELLTAAIRRDPFDNDLRIARAGAQPPDSVDAETDLAVVLGRSPEHVPAMVALGVRRPGDPPEVLDRAAPVAPGSTAARAAKRARAAAVRVPTQAGVQAQVEAARARVVAAKEDAARAAAARRRA
jgi:tetratricopeptide (TPR) repeat protein